MNSRESAFVILGRGRWGRDDAPRSLRIAARRRFSKMRDVGLRRATRFPVSNFRGAAIYDGPDRMALPAADIGCSLDR